jgi:hypothetical protein
VFNDVHGDTFIFNIDMTWTATGPLVTQTFNQKFSQDGFTFIARFVGRSRDAQASGSVNDGVTQWTPVPSTGGAIQLNGDGNLIIQTAAP